MIAKIQQIVDQEKQQILQHFINSSSFDGWSEYNLKNSCKTCGFNEHYHLLLFPEGIADLTQYFHDLLNQRMTERFLTTNSFTKISDKIIYLIELKLELYSQQKEAIRSLISYNLLPQNICAAQKRLWQSCDQIWYLTGDTATDYNYYTKRLILAKVYSTTLLYWLSDDSENYRDSKDFLRRKIKNIGIFNKWKASVSRFLNELMI